MRCRSKPTGIPYRRPLDIARDATAFEFNLTAALRDSDSRVREQGVRLAAETPGVAADFVDQLVRMADDGDRRVRFSVALALAEVPDARVVTALAAIAIRDGDDRWIRAAVLSGITSRMAEFLEAVSAARDKNPPGHAAIMEDFARVLGAGAPLTACRRLLTEIISGDENLTWRLPAALGLTEGLRGRTELKTRNSSHPLAALLADDSAATERRGSALDGLFRQAAEAPLPVAQCPYGNA